MLLNWVEWNHHLPPELVRLPPLTFWTDQAVLEFLDRYFPDGMLNVSLSGLRTKRVRLGLEQSKPAKITGIFPVSGQPDFFKVEISD